MDNRKQLNDDREIVGVQVVGYHGKLGLNQLPARRPPVYANSSDGAHVIIIGYDSDGVIVESGERPISSDVWGVNGTGTRIYPPWPATLEAPIVLILGERDIAAACWRRWSNKSEAEESDTEDDDAVARQRVSDFLQWAQGETDRSDTIRSVYVDGLFVWNCARASANELLSRIAPAARRKVISLARNENMDPARPLATITAKSSLRSASFWLSRAATTESDVLLAAAGLRLSGFEWWEDVLKCWRKASPATDKRGFETPQHGARLDPDRPRGDSEYQTWPEVPKHILPIAHGLAMTREEGQALARASTGGDLSTTTADPHDPDVEAAYNCVTEDSCDHGIIYDTYAAREMSSYDIKALFPRLDGTCSKCGFTGIAYDSSEHYLAGDW